MGIEGIEQLSESEGSDNPPKVDRPTDQEAEDKRQAELQAEREEHNRRLTSEGR